MKYHDQWIERNNIRLDFANAHASTATLTVTLRPVISGAGRFVRSSPSAAFTTPPLPEDRAFQILERTIRWLERQHWHDPNIVDHFRLAFGTPELQHAVRGDGPEPAPRRAQKQGKRP